MREGGIWQWLRRNEGNCERKEDEKQKGGLKGGGGVMLGRMWVRDQ